MRITVLLAGLLLFGFGGAARADQYRWCADYGGGGIGGGTNCYFVTLEQCRAAISGNGGYCRESGFSDGRPAAAPDHTGRKARRSRS